MRSCFCNVFACAGEGPAGSDRRTDTTDQGTGGVTARGQADSDGGSWGPAPEGPGQDQSYNRKVSVRAWPWCSHEKRGSNRNVMILCVAFCSRQKSKLCSRHLVVCVEDEWNNLLIKNPLSHWKKSTSFIRWEEFNSHLDHVSSPVLLPTCSDDRWN